MAYRSRYARDAGPISIETYTKLMAFLKDKLSPEDLAEFQTQMEDGMDPDAAVTRGGANDARPFAMNPMAGARDPVRRLRQLLTAEAEVQQAVGPVLGMDSAEMVYGVALSRLGVSTNGAHPSGFGAIFRAHSQLQRARGGARVAVDSAASASFAERFPDVARIVVLG